MLGWLLAGINVIEHRIGSLQLELRLGLGLFLLLCLMLAVSADDVKLMMILLWTIMHETRTALTTLILFCLSKPHCCNPDPCN